MTYPITFLSDLDLVVQALENQGNSFGGSTRTFALAVAREIKRLKRVQEDQERRAQVKRLLDSAKERKIRGEPDPDDDIPF